MARKDAYNCAEAVLRYIGELPHYDADVVEKLTAQLTQLGRPVVRREDWQRLEAIEQQKAAELGVELFKFKSNAEMLEAMGLA